MSDDRSRIKKVVGRERGIQIMKNSRVNKIVAPVFLFVLIIMSSAGATTSLVGHALAQHMN